MLLYDVEIVGEIELSMSEIEDGLNDKEANDLYHSLRRRLFPDDAMTGAALDDPAVRLELITWLRANGWTVEPEEK